MATAQTPQFQFTRAARHAVRLKIGIDGPSGSGKTLGALALAHGITNGGRIAVADSENDSAALYSDRYVFDRVVIPDAAPETVIAIIDAAVAERYDALVIDSISHAWLTVLAEKEDYDRKNPRTNPWTNWRIFGPRWDTLMKHLLNAPVHIIATMRSKHAYEQVETGGKKQVVKLGLQPQVREGAEYEFGIVFSVDQSHQAEATKDRTGLFAGLQLDLRDPKLHAKLIAWMNTGGDAPAAPAPAAAPAKPQLVTNAPTAAAAGNGTGAVAATTTAELTLEQALTTPLPFKGSGAFGTPIGQISIDGLVSLMEWIKGKQQERGPGWHAKTYAAMALVLKHLESAQGTLPLEGAAASDDDDSDVPAIAVGGSVPMPAPGAIADALQLTSEGEQRPIPQSAVSSATAAATTTGAPAPASDGIAALAARIGEQLQHEKLDANQRAQYRGRLDAANTVEQLQALSDEMQRQIDLPF